MAVELKVADCTQRLADQLQTLSEVAETLTFRLLELEERLAAHEAKILPLLEDHGTGSGEVSEETELRLGDTEERLARLEGLLSGLDSPGAARHLHPVGTRAERVSQQSFEDDAAFLDEAAFQYHEAFQDPQEQQFLDDQPFLDELSA